MKTLNSLLFKNIGLKLSAFFLAVLIWGIISGKEHTKLEKTLKIPIEIVNISPTIEIKSVKPEEVQLTIQGPSTKIKSLNAEKMKVRIDLKDIHETSKLNVLAEDCMQVPEGFHIINIHPRMIEINIEELIEKELKVKLRFKGLLRKDLQISNIQVYPETVKVIGFKSQIKDWEAISTEEIDLALLTQSSTLKILVKHPKEIVKFIDRKEVNIVIVLEAKK